MFRMHPLTVCKVGLATLILLGTAHSATAKTTINFDDVSNGTIIKTHYAGVTFAAVSAAGTNIYAITDNLFAASSPNVVSLDMAPLFDRRSGGIQATFASPQGAVSIDAKPFQPVEFLGISQNRPFLEAFSTSGTFLGEVLYNDPTFNSDATGSGPYQTLTFTSTANDIGSVIFSSQYNGTEHAVYGEFDNLSYGPVPEASTTVSLGMLLALGGVVMVVRKRTKTAA